MELSVLSRVGPLGRVVLDTKPFIRDFLALFHTPEAQAFVRKYARTPMEWTSIGVYLRLHLHVQKRLQRAPTTEEMAYYLYTIMTDPVLRPLALVNQPRKRKKKRALICS
jgi:hypothetical protein